MRPHIRVAEPVDRPDEGHDELVGRPLVELARRAFLLDAPAVHDHDMVGHVHGLLLVVGHEDRRHVGLVVESSQPDAQLLADARIEGAEGLVEEEDRRLDGQGASEGHALPLTA